MSVVVIVIIDRGFLIGVVGGHRRRVCHAWKLRLKRRIKLSYFYFLTSRRKLIFNFTNFKHRGKYKDENRSNFES